MFIFFTILAVILGGVCGYALQNTFGLFYALLIGIPSGWLMGVGAIATSDMIENLIKN